MTKNVLQMLEYSTKKYPNNIAFSDQNGEITYLQTVLYAKAIASYLIRLGFRNRAIAVLQNKSRFNIVCYMGVIYSGNFYVPIDKEIPETRVNSMLDEIKPIAIISDTDNFSKATDLCRDIEVLKYNNIITTEICDVIINKIREEAIDTDPVYAIFTSGTSGTPKGVICSHRSVIDYADWLVDTFHFNETTIFGNQTPFHFSMSVLDIYATIRSGAELHIIPEKLFIYPIKVLEHLNEYRINTIYWVPTALCLAVNLHALDKIELPYLKMIMFAGEVMPTKQLNNWRRRVPTAKYVNLFGPTEITDIGLYYIVNREFRDDEPIPIGKACDNMSYLILDDNGKTVESGQIGELYFRGSFLANGYYNDEKRTKEVFVQNPLNPYYTEIIYKTGDLVSMNEYGELMIHGRKDYQIKHRGIRIELGDIENAVNSLDTIERCACIFDSQNDKIILFYQSNNTYKDELKENLKNKLPAYMIPSTLIQIERMPKNQNGKINRIELEKIYKQKEGY